MNLTERVRRLCDIHGETFASLERKMDFGNGTIRRWEKTSPSGDKLAKVADYFNVSVDYLLGRSENCSTENCNIENSYNTNSDIGLLDEVYFSIAKDAQDCEIDPDDIKAAIQLLKDLKNRQNK